ncbi:prepilin peptidase [Halalkalibacter krulwichiae]|uniref:Type 4 prepilin-like proteins leader peptide-processing enzyme n=1 Tax=Halalkalibacter krulwichiae TaxID=199441 RepID=A0A1X9MDW3_9BACI|nr:A24 family peptidase [Halalkalibacter krulwichiae]ARK31606.1 Type 4 prepilin-like proteins leader peptide-processing enzyme [Halalkalibacter krulwichiae]
MICDSYFWLIGLLLGSFLNVVAIRLLKKESIAFPPSNCPNCHHRLSVLDLVPVFSYLFLKGKCRYCKAKISPLYPVGELVTASSLFLVYKVVGVQLELLPAIILTTVLVLAVLTDIREKLILDVITLPAIAILLITRLFIGSEPFWFYVVGGAVGFVLLLLIAIVSRGGMGGGDIKLYAAIGLVLGPWMTLLSFMVASFLGAVVGLLLIVTGVVKRKQPIAFGPFIFIGTLIAYLFGYDVWNWYVSLWQG